MGRLGNAVLPELVMGPLSLVIAYSFVLFFVGFEFFMRLTFDCLLKDFFLEQSVLRVASVQLSDQMRICGVRVLLHRFVHHSFG